MRTFLYCLIATLVFSCKQSDQKTKATTITGSRLSNSSLYQLDSIKSYLFIVTESEREQAKKKFLEAIDMIKNKGEVSKSIVSFKASAVLYPSEKTYFELANALIENNQLPEARQALEVSQAMGYSPLANVMYKLSALYSMMRDKEETAVSGMYVNDSLALNYMEIALQMGYSNPSDFLKNKVFDSVRYYNEWDFKNRYNSAMSGNKDPEKLVWDNYKAGFPDLTLPLTINTVWIYGQKYENAIGYDYEKFVPEMRTGKFSREVENEYYYAGKIRETTDFTALLYAGKNMWVTDGRGYSPIYLYLVTYTPTGKIIDKMVVGGHRSFSDKFRTLVLKENLYFEVKDFKNVYEKNPDDGGYENNKVIKSDLVASANYKINAKGKIEKTELLAIR